MHWEHRRANRAGIRMWPSLSGPAVVCKGMLDIISQPRLLMELRSLCLFLSYKAFVSIFVCLFQTLESFFPFILERYLGIYYYFEMH